MIKVSPTTKKTTFQVTLPEAHSVTVVGDFNGWNSSANPMKKGKSGVWKADLTLKAGEYQFRYLVDEQDWMNDEDVPVVPNDFGSNNSLVTVKFPAAKKTASKAAPKKAAKSSKAKK